MLQALAQNIAHGFTAGRVTVLLNEFVKCGSKLLVQGDREAIHAHLRRAFGLWSHARMGLPQRARMTRKSRSAGNTSLFQSAPCASCARCSDSTISLSSRK